MELRHVYGRTYAAVGATALMPVYKLTDTDIVLMDTGYAKLDRSALTNLVEDNGFRLRGILCSHAHFDHTGNVRYLQQRYGCQAAAQIIEAGISVNPDAYRANYVALTYGKSHEYFLEECFLADVIIPADADHVDFCGARVGRLQLPGHSAGHIGIVTPDNVAYVGDCLIDEGQIEGAKLPTSMFIARDLESKESLRALRCPANIIAPTPALPAPAPPPAQNPAPPQAQGQKPLYCLLLTDIGPLIDRNLAFILDKGQEVLDCLEDGMSFDQWIYTFCKKENVRTHNEFKFSVVERNFANFVDWLADEGRIEVRREFCAKHYFRRDA